MNSCADAERERFSRQVIDCAEEAFARMGRVERAFRFNGRTFLLRFAGEALANLLPRALNHLATEERGDVALTIDCWDVAATGVPMPIAKWRTDLYGPKGELRGLDSPGMRAAYFDWLDLLNVYLPASGRAFYCLGGAGKFPVQQLGSPALTILSWWFATLGWQFTHAAALATERGGVLVVGHGGAGKSTLSFSMLGSSLRYVSDDYCVLLPGRPPQVLAIYSSGKLTETSISLLPHLRKHAFNADDTGREKAVFFLHEQFPGALLPRAELRAIVMPRLGGTETALTPVSWREVIEVLAASTLCQLAGSDQKDFFRLVQIARSLPAYRLDHGRDKAATHQLLCELCDS